MTEQKNPKHHSGSEIIWRAAEYEFTQKTPMWYVIIGIAGTLLVVLALFAKNFFFGVFIILATGIVMAFGKRKPRIIDFKVTEEGVGIGKQFLDYDRIEHFAIWSRPGHLDEFIFKKKVMVNPFVHVPIDSALGKRVQSMLLLKLPEVEHQVSLVDIFAEWLGF